MDGHGGDEICHGFHLYPESQRHRLVISLADSKDAMNIAYSKFVKDVTALFDRGFYLNSEGCRIFRSTIVVDRSCI